MSSVFISHSEEEAQLALQIALGLEELGHPTWCYEVDSVPGVSYLVQTGQAIDRADAVVVVISRRSIASHQVTREVERGHESGKPFIPILVNLSHPEFQAAQPTWRQALGTATSLPVVPGDRQATAARLASGLRALGISQGGPPGDRRIEEIRAALARFSGPPPAPAAASGKGSSGLTPPLFPSPSISRGARFAPILTAAGVAGVLGGLWLWGGLGSSKAGPTEGGAYGSPAWEAAFRNQRPSGGSGVVPASQAVYVLKTAPLAAEPAGDSAAASAREAGVIGITLLRLRPAEKSDDERVRVLVHEDPARPPREWTPLRVESDAVLSEGDRIRVAIETPRSGYLYVIDRELHADGNLGPPYAIFPTLRTRGGDNSTRSGRLLEVPGWDDTPPYFTLTRSSPVHVGEVLTIFLSPRPLPDFSIGREAGLLATGQVEEWERRWGRPVERLELAGGAGKPYSRAERDAGGDGARLLTQEEPLPQTLYRVRAAAGDPLIVTVPLRIRE